MGYICCRICKYKSNVYSYRTILQNFKARQNRNESIDNVKNICRKIHVRHGTTPTLSKTVQSK